MGSSSLGEPRAHLRELDAEFGRAQQVSGDLVELIERERVGVRGDDGVILECMDGVIGGDVGCQEAVERLGQPSAVEQATWREDAGHEAVDGQDVRFVDRDPVPAQVTELVDAATDPADELGRGLLMSPRLRAQPRRVGEVLCGHHRDHASLDDAGQDRAVAINGTMVDHTFGRLDSGPLDREPEGVEPNRRRSIELAEWIREEACCVA